MRVLSPKERQRQNMVMERRTNNRKTFNLIFSEEEVVQFNVESRAFQDITIEDVHKVLTKGTLVPTKATMFNDINFMAKIGDPAIHNVGFINNYENDLDEDSTPEEKKAVIDVLTKKLSKLKVKDIVPALTREEGRELLDAL